MITTWTKNYNTNTKKEKYYEEHLWWFSVGSNLLDDFGLQVPFDT